MDAGCENDVGSLSCDPIMVTSVASQGDSVSSPGSDGSPGCSKKQDIKKCGVCGDRALGYNFNAITCESCKAFFRRNALKNKNFRCPFNDTCNVDVVTRRFCQKCRLRKCFKIGMKKEWIMSDEEKQKKKQKIEENRAKKQGETSVSSPEDVKSPIPASPVSPFFSSTFTSSSEGSKPQAVVVGMVRSDDDVHCKVMKKANSIDVHSTITAATSSRLTGIEATNFPQVPLHDISEKNSQELSIFKVTPDHITSQGDYCCVSPLSDDCTTPISADVITPVINVPPYSSNNKITSTVSTNATSTISERPLVNNCETSARVIQKSPPGFHTLLGDSVVSSPAQSVTSPVQDIPVKKEYDQEDSVSSGMKSDLTLQDGCLTDNIEALKVWHDFNVIETLNFIQPNSKDQDCSSDSSMMESIVNTAVSAEYSAFKLLSNSDSKELNVVERRKLNELHEANKGLMAPLCEDDNFKDQLDPSLINIINMTEIAIRRLIMMSKRISAFKNLCQDDQIALLKGGCTEMMILRSVSAYDPDKDSWKIQQDHERYKSIKLKVLKAASGNVYEEHKKFILAFQPSWRKDQNIMHLLSAITLFTPKRPNIVHPNAIRHEQSIYLLLLKRYLECSLGGCEGKTVYYCLLERIKQLHILNENHVNIFMQVNTHEIAPLLIEIFDLKQR